MDILHLKKNKAQKKPKMKNKKMKKIIKTVIGILIVIGASLLMWSVRNDN